MKIVAAYKQTIWFDWKHVNPTIKAFNLTSSLTHCRPINPILNPKASPPLCGQCATHRHKSLSSASFSPRPHSIVHVSLQGWIWVQPQLASLGYDLFCCEGCTCTKYLDKGHTSIKQNSAAYWSDVIVIANSAVLLLVKDILSVILFLEEVHVCVPGEKAFLTKPLKTRGTTGQVEAMKTVPKDDMKYKGKEKRNEYSEHWYLIENWLKTDHFDQLHDIDLGTEITVFLVAVENTWQLRILKVFLFLFLRLSNFFCIWKSRLLRTGPIWILSELPASAPLMQKTEKHVDCHHTGAIAFHYGHVNKTIKRI